MIVFHSLFFRLSPCFASVPVHYFGKATTVALSAKNSAKIKEKVGYVPSDVHYNPDATAGELLKTTLAFHRIQSEVTMRSLCDALEIELNQPCGELSVSDQKMVAIACAMVHEPRLLILDDPGKGLDPAAKRRVFELLREANQEGTTIFLASNSLVEVQDYCTRVALIEGRTCDSGCRPDKSTQKSQDRGTLG